MTSRVLIVPAAGVGSRLKTAQPKALVHVGGRPMIQWIVELYGRHVDLVVLVIHPSHRDAIDAWIGEQEGIETVEQQHPTGMLDAILLARQAVERFGAGAVWITWCDQIGVLPSTVERLAALAGGSEPPSLLFPTATLRGPYIHFPRDASGRIVGVLQKREGDEMPVVGESDMGLFALSSDAYRVTLPEYARQVPAGRGTGERNFLPFIPWIASRAAVTTFPCFDPMEATGVNTPEDLTVVEAWLRRSGRL